jgi:hypothetical protein
MTSGSNYPSNARFEQSYGENAQPTSLPDCSYLIRPEQTFALIESTMLTFEVCLYHQVLPMSLDGHRMLLGMVDPSDEEALSYIQTILAYLNYTLIPNRISLQAHKETLSAFLKYRENRQETGAQKMSEPEMQAPSPLELAPALTPRSSPQSSPLLGLPSPALPTDLNSRETVFIEEEEEMIAAAQTVVIFTTSDAEDESSSVSSGRDAIAAPPPASKDEQRTTEQIEVNPRQFATEIYHPTPGQSDFDARVPTTSNPTLVLDLQPRYLSSPIKLLETLPAQDILNELLARVLSGGIGRLFFERAAMHGRVIWSQNGIIKAELENLPLTVFDELILSLKRLHNLPLPPTVETVRVEIERFYEQQRLLLRLQVIPGPSGEEANLQILRGVALQFYQQRQLASASRDALNVSQKLQNKINDIYNRAVSNNIPEKAQIEMITALSKIVDSMDEQIRALDTLNSET